MFFLFFKSISYLRFYYWQTLMSYDTRCRKNTCLHLLHKVCTGHIINQMKYPAKILSGSQLYCLTVSMQTLWLSCWFQVKVGLFSSVIQNRLCLCVCVCVLCLFRSCRYSYGLGCTWEHCFTMLPSCLRAVPACVKGNQINCTAASWWQLITQ